MFLRGCEKQPLKLSESRVLSLFLIILRSAVTEKSFSRPSFVIPRNAVTRNLFAVTSEDIPKKICFGDDDIECPVFLDRGTFSMVNYNRSAETAAKHGT